MITKKSRTIENIGDVKNIHPFFKHRIKRFLAYLYSKCKNKDKTVNDIRILYYHSIGNEYEWSILPEQFEKQMKYIADNYKVISLCSLISNEMKLFPSRKKVVIITFDDGWEDNYTHAFPILKHHGFHATFFVTTKLITKEVYIKNKETMEPLTVKQILEMDNNGMDFGSHTCSHPNLCQIDLDSVKYELSQSKETLEKILGCEVDTFCYPLGLYNSKIIELVKNAGYQLAVATSWGGFNSKTNRFILPRIRIESKDQIQDFIDKIEGNWDFVRIIQLIKYKINNCVSF